jgi:hypothetical protein
MDDPRYRSGLNVCRNTIPLEEGSATRRPGTRLIRPTRQGAFGVLRAFDFSEAHPYLLELTAGHLRLIAGTNLVVESFGEQTVASVSSANPAVVLTGGAHGWTTGDEVQFKLDPASAANSGVAPLLGRDLAITVLSTTTFSIADALTGANIDGSTVNLGSSILSVFRIADFPTTYASTELSAVNQVQDQSNLLLLHKAHIPYAVQSTSPEAGSSFAVFSLGQATFLDGPYLDPPTDGTTITASAKTGSVTLTLAGGSTRFSATDVGRLVRLFSEPAAWAIATSYVIGDQVKYNGDYYQALAANTGKQPDADLVNWGVSTTAAAWTWATITAFTDTTHVTATIKGADLLRTTACATWRLGLFSATTGYPTCGTYHEGRLWLAGVIGNRLDGSNSNDFFNFAPTSADGTVADNNACAYVFNAQDVNQIFWMEPDALGIICGTQAGEWLVQASAQNDPLTPTSVQAHRRTKYGCANVPAKRSGTTIAFVQRYNQKLLEYVTTDFRGLSAKALSTTGKHLLTAGISELAYQREKTPILWARTGNDTLVGCTYRRESPYASDPPDFAGWHRHDLAGGYTVKSIQVGPNFDGTLDALTMVVKDPATGFHYSQLLTDTFDVDWAITDAFFVDFAETPSMYEFIAGTPNILRFYSLHYLAGKTVDVFLGGIDCGQIAVAADGHLDVPVDSTTIPLLTSTWLASLNSSSNFHGLGVAIQRTPAGTANVPTLTGVLQFDLSTMNNNFNGGFEVDWDLGYSVAAHVADSLYVVDDIKTGARIAGPISCANVSSGFKLGEDGCIYGAVIASNQAILHRINRLTGVDIVTFGVSSSSFTTDATHWAFPNDFDTFKSGNNLFLISTAANVSQTSNQVSVLNLGANTTDAIAWDGVVHHLDEGGARVTRGKPTSSGIGRAFVLAAGSLACGLYQFTVQANISSKAKIGLVAATGIPGWTHFTSLGGICCDETDGHILADVTEVLPPAFASGSTYAAGDLVSIGGHDYFSLQGSNTGHTPASSPTFWQDLGVSGPAESRIIKISSHTGAVLWSLVVADSVISNTNRVQHGRLNILTWLSSNSALSSINTATGVATVTPNLNSLVGGTPQTTNDLTGEIILKGVYASGGTLAQIGSTSASFTGLMTLGPAAGPAVPAALPPTDGVVWTVPAAIGFTYTSQGQILRPIAPQETGAQNGPALGKTRRTHMFAALLQQTQGISFGTDFTKMRVGRLRSGGGSPFALTTLYSSILQDNLEDDYSFDSMLCWQITRPYPATVCTLGAFLHTQDR